MTLKHKFMVYWKWTPTILSGSAWLHYMFSHMKHKNDFYFFQRKQCVHQCRPYSFAETQWSPMTSIGPDQDNCNEVKTMVQHNYTMTSEKRLNIQCMILGNEPVPESLFKKTEKKDKCSLSRNSFELFPRWSFYVRPCSRTACAI